MSSKAEVEERNETVLLQLERVIVSLQKAREKIRRLKERANRIAETINRLEEKLREAGSNPGAFIQVSQETFEKLRRLCDIFGLDLHEEADRAINEWLKLCADSNWEPYTLDPELPERLSRMVLES